MDDIERKDLIVKAIATQGTKGVALIRGEYTSIHERKFDTGHTIAVPCMCPMSCLVATFGDERCEEGPAIDAEAARILHVDLLWVRGFISGFDNTWDEAKPAHETLDLFKRGFTIGKDLAREYHINGDISGTEDRG